MTQTRRMLAPPPENDRVDALVLSPREIQSYSLLRGIDAARSGNWNDAGFEREIDSDLATRAGKSPMWSDRHSFFVPPQILARQKRDLTVAAAGAAGFLVDSKVVGVVDALRELLRVSQLGAQRLTGLRSNASCARQGTRATVSWQPTEATQAAETNDLGFGSIALTPKTLTAYIELSRQLRLQAPDLAEYTLRREFAASLATTIDGVAIAGTGASGQPLGIVNTTGIGTFNGASITYANALEAQTDILNANALATSGEVGFLCRPAVASVLAQRQGFSTVSPMWVGPLAAGRLNGCPAFSSMNVPASTLIAGDFTQLLIAEFGTGLEIRVNPYANFQAGVTGFLASMSVDIALLQPSAFSVATSVT